MKIKFLPIILSLSIIVIFFIGCNRPKEETIENLPNILWISCEDLSPHFDFYGEHTIPTPNLSRLAKEGIVYDNAFTTAGVCAPSRCAIITGMNQISTGGHNMRTLSINMPDSAGLPKAYSIVPPPDVKAFPEYLRAKGYYCTNNPKTDYQFEAPPTVWDESSRFASWKNRAEGQPFFAVVNFNITHESKVWERKNHPLHVSPDSIPIPSIYPDTKTVRKDLARFYSNVVDLDSLVGALLLQLEAEGILENTIIFFWGDHGDGLPFFKREIYDRGLKIPLVVRFPDKKDAGTRDDQLISAIDFGPTVLSLAGIDTPPNMQGKPFLGEYKKEPHQFIYAARDRMDNEYDRVRAVRDNRYKYIRNFYPDKPLYQDIKYRLNQDMMKEMLELKDKGALDSIQMKWFASTKAPEELYDLQKDPDEFINLANDPNYQTELVRLRKEMDRWLEEMNDRGSIPEKELIKQMWGGLDYPRKTNDVLISVVNNKVALSSSTEGASIGYKVIGENGVEEKSWKVYTGPFEISSSQTVKAVSQRIGYERSSETVYSR